MKKNPLERPTWNFAGTHSLLAWKLNWRTDDCNPCNGTDEQKPAKEPFQTLVFSNVVRQRFHICCKYAFFLRLFWGRGAEFLCRSLGRSGLGFDEIEALRGATILHFFCHGRMQLQGIDQFLLDHLQLRFFWKCFGLWWSRTLALLCKDGIWYHGEFVRRNTGLSGERCYANRIFFTPCNAFAIYLAFIFGGAES